VTYEVIFSPTARRDMASVPPRIIPAIVEFAYGDLAAFPRRVGKPLERELAGSYSARRGGYRILYDIDEEKQQVSILRVVHRADVYRTS
jgi:mRNA-degrading endonuclease RelE of RelBE toxin-antitoxin system